ncbi:DUF1904 family protein [Ferrimonas sediminicola]|uniref:DUF1904 family protein n=1 Tax=Ferrimonas sediminicola TaxID=2569538 RepID=A0A4U1BCC1_9GAMM|nr:DUF1904 family protein [Ferrimonas sediminicola]TKB48316.1 DUF1904 family protein [Ferrimonas sediminicola]
MPHIRISGVERQQVMHMSQNLVDQLAEVVGCPRDHFTIELLPTEFIFDDKMDANRYPIIDVHWFERGQQIQDKAAGIITGAIRGQLKEEEKGVEICVRFFPLDPFKYYENGAHFG